MFALVLQVGGVHRHHFGRFQFHRGIDQHPLHRLEVADRVAELLALVRVGIRALESGFRDPDRERGDADASAVEHGQRLFATAPRSPSSSAFEFSKRSSAVSLARMP